MSREASLSQALIPSFPFSPAEGCEHGRPTWYCVPQCPSGRPERCPAGGNPQLGTPGERQTEHLTFFPRAPPHGATEDARADSTRQRGGPEDVGKGSKATQQAEENSSDIIHCLIGSESPRKNGAQRDYTSTCISCYPGDPLCGPPLCWTSC